MLYIYYVQDCSTIKGNDPRQHQIFQSWNHQAGGRLAFGNVGMSQLDMFHLEGKSGNPHQTIFIDFPSWNAMKNQRLRPP